MRRCCTEEPFWLSKFGENYLDIEIIAITSATAARCWQCCCCGGGIANNAQQYLGEADQASGAAIFLRSGTASFVRSATAIFFATTRA